MIELIGKVVSRDSQSKIEMLNSTIDEKEEALKRLERACSQKKHQLDRLVDESIICRHQLLQKSNFLRKKSDELYRVQEKLKHIKNRIALVEQTESENKILIKKISKLEKLINNDSKINDSKLQKSQETVEQGDYIRISKDQFREIEKRLKEYKKRAELLEDENSKLVATSERKKEFNFLEQVNSSITNLRDVSFPDFFKDNHVKVTKA